MTKTMNTEEVKYTMNTNRARGARWRYFWVFCL